MQSDFYPGQIFWLNNRKQATLVYIQADCLLIDDEGELLTLSPEALSQLRLARQFSFDFDRLWQKAARHFEQNHHWLYRLFHLHPLQIRNRLLEFGGM